MEEYTCLDCATYDDSSFICSNGKNPINPKAKIKIAPDCPACEHLILKHKTRKT